MIETDAIEILDVKESRHFPSSGKKVPSQKMIKLKARSPCGIIQLNMELRRDFQNAYQKKKKKLTELNNNKKADKLKKCKLYITKTKTKIKNYHVMKPKPNI